MEPFASSRTQAAGLTFWRGQPDDDAAHQAVVAWLSASLPPDFPLSSTSISSRTKGNIGEFIVYNIGRSSSFPSGAICEAANAWDPLSNISRPGIDLLWVCFDLDNSDDWAVVQEVKTTGQDKPDLARELVSDYDKLFGEDVRLTLQTRLGSFKNKLDQLDLSHMATRVSALAGQDPSSSSLIRLTPTLVHNSLHDSTPQLTTVRRILIEKGWSSESIDCWSVALSDIDDRLSRIARGRA